MRRYKKLNEETGNIFWDRFATRFNLVRFRKMVIKIATDEHKRTGRQVHVAEMFNSFFVFDSRERDDINKSGKVVKMNLVELLKASIWNSNQLTK